MSLEGRKNPFPDAGKPESRFEDNRFGGKTVASARKDQQKNYRVKMMIQQAERAKSFGMDLDPSQQFILDNKDLLRG